ncbi:MAG: hypothetical protein ACI9VR_001677 [Cognaticolwellia sp.]
MSGPSNFRPELWLGFALTIVSVVYSAAASAEPEAPWSHEAGFSAGIGAGRADGGGGGAFVGGGHYWSQHSQLAVDRVWATSIHGGGDGSVVRCIAGVGASWDLVPAETLDMSVGGAMTAGLSLKPDDGDGGFFVAPRFFARAGVRPEGWRHGWYLEAALQTGGVPILFPGEVDLGPEFTLSLGFWIDKAPKWSGRF